MRILCFGKYPPIQGGVSRAVYWAVRAAAATGHSVDVITNAWEVEHGARTLLSQEDLSILSPPNTKVHFTHITPVDSCMACGSADLSKLVGLGHDVAYRRKPDLIIGWYLEPYGIAASIVGNILKLPVVLIHAGSDIGRLAKHDNLAQAFRLAFSLSSVVVTNPDDRILGILSELGASQEKLWFPQVSPLPDVYSTVQPKLDVAEICRTFANSLTDYPLPWELVSRIIEMNAKPGPRQHVPTLGVYGKVGRSKSSFDLIDTLSTLAEKGVRFNFLSIPVGSALDLESYSSKLIGSLALQKCSWMLPPLAPWRIPSFLASCDVAFYLEHKFSIPYHSTAQIAREILASRTALVCSREVVENSGFGMNLVDGKNAVIVEDPSDHLSFEEKVCHLLSEPDAISSLAAHGKALSDFIEQNAPGQSLIEDLIVDFPAWGITSDQIMNTCQ